MCAETPEFLCRHNQSQGGRDMEIFPGILMDPGIRFGKPCLAGTRIDVATIVGALAGRESYEEKV